MIRTKPAKTGRADQRFEGPCLPKRETRARYGHGRTDIVSCLLK